MELHGLHPVCHPSVVEDSANVPGFWKGLVYGVRARVHWVFDIEHAQSDTLGQRVRNHVISVLLGGSLVVAEFSRRLRVTKGVSVREIVKG